MRRNGVQRLLEGLVEFIIVVVVPHKDSQCRALEIVVMLRRTIDDPSEPLRDVVPVCAPTSGPAGPVAAVSSVVAAADHAAGAALFAPLVTRSPVSDLSIVLAAVRIESITVSLELDLPLVLATFLQAAGLVACFTFFTANCLPCLVLVRTAALFSTLYAVLAVGIQTTRTAAATSSFPQPRTLRSAPGLVALSILLAAWRQQFLRSFYQFFSVRKIHRDGFFETSAAPAAPPRLGAFGSKSLLCCGYWILFSFVVAQGPDLLQPRNPFRSGL